MYWQRAWDITNLTRSHLIMPIVNLGISAPNFKNSQFSFLFKSMRCFGWKQLSTQLSSAVPGLNWLTSFEIAIKQFDTTYLNATDVIIYFIILAYHPHGSQYDIYFQNDCVSSKFTATVNRQQLSPANRHIGNLLELQVINQRQTNALKANLHFSFDVFYFTSLKRTYKISI